jgi:hypothetical protein
MPVVSNTVFLTIIDAWLEIYFFNISLFQMSEEKGTTNLRLLTGEIIFIIGILKFYQSIEKSV